jgi:hypothetical protein
MSYISQTSRRFGESSIRHEDLKFNEYRVVTIIDVFQSDYLSNC